MLILLTEFKKLNTCLQAVKFLRHAEGGHRRAKGRDEEEDEHSNGRLVTPSPSPPLSPLKYNFGSTATRLPHSLFNPTLGPTAAHFYIFVILKLLRLRIMPFHPFPNPKLNESLHRKYETSTNLLIITVAFKDYKSMGKWKARSTAAVFEPARVVCISSFGKTPMQHATFSPTPIGYSFKLHLLRKRQACWMLSWERFSKNYPISRYKVKIWTFLKKGQWHRLSAPYAKS